MATNKVKIEIFGAEIVCASCVNAPSSKDTYEWLQAAIGRKYPEQPYDIEYIDIYSTYCRMKTARYRRTSAEMMNFSIHL